jgi:predicted permease
LQHAAAREHEMAVRVAVGADPGRLVRQLMTESLLLAFGGVLVGAAVLVWAHNALEALAPTTPLPLVAETAIDARVGIVVAIVGLSTVFVFGLVPAMRAARVAVRTSLTGAGATRGGSAAAGRLRGVLVGSQFALTLAVLITAGLFLRRLDELQRVDRGFRDPEHVVLGTIDFTVAGVREPSLPRILTERMVERIGALPGVRAAAAASFVPLGFVGYEALEANVDGYVPQAGEQMRFLVNRVSAGYFSTMGIAIVRGREIDAADRDGARPVVVVNEAFARRFWGKSEPIDRRIRLDGREVTIVGVAADGKYEFLAPLDGPSPPFVYLPFAQWGNYTVVLHARAAGDAMALVPSIQRAVAAIDSRLNVMSPGTLDSYSSVPYLPIRLGSSVLTVMSVAALALATFGLYAVTAYAVAERRREIGIRIALGATPSNVVLHFVAHAARYTAGGTVAGIALAVVISRGLGRLPGLLPRVVTDRLWPFAIAVGMLAAVAVVAALIPANRAARLNPTVSLREE